MTSIQPVVESGLRMRSSAEAAVEALEVRPQAEGPAAMHRHDLVGAVPEQEAAVERRHPRRGQRQVFAVQPAGRKRFGHRGACQWNSRRRLSQARPRKPASGTSAAGYRS